MKLLILLFALFFVNLGIYSQYEITPVTANDSLRFEALIKKGIDSLKIDFEKKNFQLEREREFQSSFASDIFRIEKRFEYYVAQDYSNYGLMIAGSNMLNEYEKLLNKYYRILLNQLEEKDKETLRIAQRNWLKYRETELQLNYLVIDEKYSGGGTIQNDLAMARSIEIVKQRVMELSGYIWRSSFSRL